MSCCGKPKNDLNAPLVANEFLKDASILSKSLNYNSINNFNTIASYSTVSSLLDPSGHLSEELLNVLNEVWNKYTNGLLIMTKDNLIKYYQNCYPNLSQLKYYNDRAEYILNKYGKSFRDIQNKLKLILNNNNNNNNNNKKEIIDTYSPYTRKRKKKLDKDLDEKEEVKYNIINKQHHSISINEDRPIIESTISLSLDLDVIVLLKTKYFLLYRKLCVDKPIMVRIEMTSLGYDEFRSGMILDRSKQLDKLAFNIQQLRNRYNTHLEEKKRINNASQPSDSAKLIEKYIQQNIDPLDNNHDNTNLFRKRRPIKYPRCCHVLCCCC